MGHLPKLGQDCTAPAARFRRSKTKQLTLRQNLELRELNASLDAKVKERTAQLCSALSALEETNRRLMSRLAQ
jgi:hypothetical protein